MKRTKKLTPLGPIITIFNLLEGILVSFKFFHMKYLTDKIIFYCADKLAKYDHFTNTSQTLLFVCVWFGLRLRISMTTSPWKQCCHREELLY